MTKAQDVKEKDILIVDDDADIREAIETALQELGNVRISTVAIAQGNLTIRITETPQVSQPGAFAPEGAQTTTVARSGIEIDEGRDNRLAVLNTGVNLQDMVSGLNALGIGPRDMITILQAIKAVGAMQAELEML